MSEEEAYAIAQLGGLDRVAREADAILREHGIHRSLMPRKQSNGFPAAERQAFRRIILRYRDDFSIRANLDDLFRQAHDLQANAGGTAYVGAMLQHLVGAKLDLVLGRGHITHHGSSVSDQATDRRSDFVVETVAIHVTTHPSEALIRKCEANLQAGLKPLIVTLDDGVAGAAFLLKGTALASRVDVLDAGQFLTANIYERSFFKAADCRVTLANLLQRYNEIVAECETDPALQVRLLP